MKIIRMLNIIAIFCVSFGTALTTKTQFQQSISFGLPKPLSSSTTSQYPVFRKDRTFLNVAEIRENFLNKDVSGQIQAKVYDGEVDGEIAFEDSSRYGMLLLLIQSSILLVQIYLIVCTDTFPINLY